MKIKVTIGWGMATLPLERGWERASRARAGRLTRLSTNTSCAAWRQTSTPVVSTVRAAKASQMATTGLHTAGETGQQSEAGIQGPHQEALQTSLMIPPRGCKCGKYFVLWHQTSNYQTPQSATDTSARSIKPRLSTRVGAITSLLTRSNIAGHSEPVILITRDAGYQFGNL